MAFRARIQYDLTQQPRLLQQLPTSLIELLRLALQSHRHALKLGPQNADVILLGNISTQLRTHRRLMVSSNTAQVLTSVAELISEGNVSNTNKQESLQLLQEALGLFQRCLVLQESQYTKAEDETRLMTAIVIEDQEQPLSVADSTSDGAGQEQWASIVEPVTKSNLLDTVLAQVQTLTDMCGLVANETTGRLPWIEELSRDIVQDKLASYATASDRTSEASMVRANFMCAYVDASFRVGGIDLPTYEREVDNAFSIPGLANSPQGLCDRADALVALCSSVRATVKHAELQEVDADQPNKIQWKALSRALSDLKAASTLPDAQNLARIHLRRGDCELLRCRLGETPTSYEPSRSNAAMLLKNAEVYYRGAAGAALADRSQSEEFEARLKESAVSTLMGDARKLSALVNAANEKALLVMEEMRDEGLIADQFFQSVRNEAFQ